MIAAPIVALNFLLLVRSPHLQTPRVEQDGPPRSTRGIRRRLPTDDKPRKAYGYISSAWASRGFWRRRM